MKIKILAVIILLSLGLHAQTKNKKTIKAHTKKVAIKANDLDDDQWYRKAYDLNDKKNRKEALLCINKAIAIADSIPEYYVLKCYITGNLGDNETCLETADIGLKLAPENDELWHLKGTSLHFLKQPEASFACYDKALQYDNQRALYYNNYLDALKYQKKYDQMILVYNLFEKTKKQNAINGLEDYEADIHFYGALAYQVKGDLNKAVNLLSQSIELSPDYAPYYNNRGLIYTDLQQYTNALADYNKGIAMLPNDAQLYYNRAITFLELKDYAKAEKDILQHLKIEGENADALVNLGNAYGGLKQYENAEKAYLKAKKLDPTNKIVDNNLADLYIKMGKTKQSENAIEQALQKTDNPAKVNYNRGHDLAVNDQYKEAIPYLEKAIELNPNHAASYNELGLCYAHFQDYNKAISLYTKGLLLDPTEKAFYINRGNAFKNLQKHTEAENDYKQFNKLFPTQSGIGYYSLANLYINIDTNKTAQYFKLADQVNLKEKEFYIDYLSFLSDKDPKTGLLFAEKALENFPTQYKVMLNVASIYESNNRIDKAEALLLKTNKQFPKEVGGFYNLGNLYLVHTKDFLKAKIQYNKAIQNKPNFAAPYLNLATVYQNLSDYKNAEKTFELLLKNFPNSYEGYYNVGDYYTRRGNYNQAITAFDKSFELMDAEVSTTQSNPNIILKDKSEKALLKAQAYQQLKKYDKATAALEEYLLFNQTNASAYGNYAYCLFEVNQPEKAIVNFEKAYQLNSNEIDFVVGLVVSNYLMNNKVKISKYKNIIKKQFKNYPCTPDLLTILEHEGYFYTDTFKNIWTEAIK